MLGGAARAAVGALLRALGALVFLGLGAIALAYYLASHSLPDYDARYRLDSAPGEIEVTDPGALPDWTQNWVGIGFRHDDADFVAAFNEAQAAYLGESGA
mgnify:CR=1 FL=1